MTVRAGVLVAGRYRVEEPVGSGGMGVVWRARDERDDRTVALKRAHEDGDERALRRTEREARRAAVLTGHSRVVGLYDVVIQEGVCWLVMEYVAGRDLDKILTDDGVRPAAVVARIGRQVAEALEAVHGSGLVHGDVSPGNVLITEAGDAKLTDFGAARRIWGDVTVTESGEAPGTAPYLAPEVARGEDKVPASDVFSLGATLFTAAEGVSPLGRGDNPRAYMYRSASGKIAAPSVAGPLGAVLSALLAPDPADRPDAAEARRRLAEAEDGGDAGAVAGEAAMGTAQARAAATGEAAIGAGEARSAAAGEATMGAGAHGPGTGAGAAVPGTGGGAKPWRGRFWPLAAGTAVVVVVAAVALVAVRPWESGAARPPSGAATGARQAAGTADAATIGDARTADPCGLISAADFRTFGPAILAAEYGNFDRCDVLVSTRTGEDLGDVSVELDTEWPSAESGDRRTRTGRVIVNAHPSGDPDECDRALLLPDRNAVYVTAKRAGPGGSMDFCRAAGIATAKAARVLNQGPVPRRVAAPDARSLARARACELLPGTEIAQVPGLDGATAEPGFGDWRCSWTARHGVPEVDLTFDRGNPLQAGEDGKAARVAGRSAFVQAGDDGPDTCVIAVVQRRYEHSDGEPAEELVNLEVRGPGSMTERCGQAQTLATAAMNRLPHT